MGYIATGVILFVGVFGGYFLFWAFGLMPKGGEQMGHGTKSAEGRSRRWSSVR
ncbi:hypothetical protein [Bacillus sp. ISL-7]|uniref:hypothetical protein n=1 Tax=Bacillus sp. ISL-7 TaxID=2819136 RepID=UPI001BE96C80|nr:hypothetical protein [Bacillus sp. ISL-7]MBT2735179.1 hypothetical protein [Bacillus sp. ISL-7]